MIWLALLLSLVCPFDLARADVGYERHGSSVEDRSTTAIASTADPLIHEIIRIDIPEHCSQALHREVVDQTFSWKHDAQDYVAGFVANWFAGRPLGRVTLNDSPCWIGMQPALDAGDRAEELVVPRPVMEAVLKIPLERWEPLAHEIAHVFWTHEFVRVTLPDNVIVEVWHAP